MGRTPYTSSIEQYLIEIIHLRREKPPVTYKNIAKILQDKHQVKITANGVYRFLRQRVNEEYKHKPTKVDVWKYPLPKETDPPILSQPEIKPEKLETRPEVKREIKPEVKRIISPREREAEELRKKDPWEMENIKGTIAREIREWDQIKENDPGCSYITSKTIKELQDISDSITAEIMNTPEGYKSNWDKVKATREIKEQIKQEQEQKKREREGQQLVNHTGYVEQTTLNELKRMGCKVEWVNNKLKIYAYADDHNKVLRIIGAGRATKK